MENSMNKHFIEEDIMIVNKHMKKCLTSLAIMEMQITTIMKHDYTFIRISKIKNNDNTKCQRCCRESESFLLLTEV